MAVFTPAFFFIVNTAPYWYTSDLKCSRTWNLDSDGMGVFPGKVQAKDALSFVALLKKYWLGVLLEELKYLIAAFRPLRSSSRTDL